MSAFLSPAFHIKEIQDALQANGVQWVSRVEYFEMIDSTNAYLMREKAPVHGSLCVADYQSQGRGRRGKQWQADVGTSLMFSLGYAPKCSDSVEMSLVVGVAIADVLVKLGLNNIGLKWPNDILVEGKKLAGILLESRHLGAKSELVIGVGLNVDFTTDQLSKISAPSISLAQLGLLKLEKQALLLELVSSISVRLQQFEAQGFAPARASWLAYHVQNKGDVSYEYKGQACIGRVRGLSESGALLLESEGEIHYVTSGEVNSIRSAV